MDFEKIYNKKEHETKEITNLIKSDTTSMLVDPTSTKMSFLSTPFSRLIKGDLKSKPVKIAEADYVFIGTIIVGHVQRWKWGWDVQDLKYNKTEITRLKKDKSKLYLEHEQLRTNKLLRDTFVLLDIKTELLIRGLCYHYFNFDYIYEAETGPGVICIFGLWNVKETNAITDFTKIESTLQPISLDPRCETCLKTLPELKSSGGSLFSCSQCRIAQYCSRDCQRTAWPNHKQTCGK